MSDAEEPKLTERQIRRRRDTARRGKADKGQPERAAKHARELRKFNLKVPISQARHEQVQALKDIKGYMRETWQKMLPDIETYKRLTPKQVEFARQYALNGRTSARKALEAAGYEYKEAPIARARARELLTREPIQKLVAAFEIEEKARMKINVEDVVKWFNDIAMAAMDSGDFTNANRAMENLAKYLGMFVEKKEILHKTVQSKEELDTRIAELTAILREAEPDIERKLRIN